MPQAFSKEPLAPAVVDGDSRWGHAVNWAIFATIQAEEFAVTSANVEQMAAGDDARIVQFLGGANADGETLDPGLGISADFAHQVVARSATTARSSTTTSPPSSSNEDSTPSGRTAASNTPRLTADGQRCP